MSKPDEKLPEGHRLRTVAFRQAVSNGRYTSATVGERGMVELVPAQLTPDGNWMAIDKGQRVDGIGIREKVFEKGSNRIRRSFVPFVNVDELTYGE